MKADWPMKTLDDLINDGIVELGRGKVISKKDLADFPGTYPVYSSAKNNEGKFGEYGKYMFDEELITWSVDGGGRLFYRPKHRFSITNVGGYIRIKRPDLVSYRFLYFCLSLLQSRIQFDWVKKAHPSVIRKLYKEIPLPPLPDQKRIVAILDEAFAGIDTAIANTEKNLANARELFESYLNAVFSQRGEGWESRKLTHVGKIQTGNTPKTSEKDNYGDHVPFIKPGDFHQDGSLNYSNNGLSKKGSAKARLVPENSVLMVCIGATIGKTAFVSGNVTTNQQINALTPTKEHASKFIYYQMLTNRFQKSVILSSGQTTLPIISKKKWGELELIFPISLEEQFEIVAILDDLSSEVRRLESIYQQKLTALAELKQSLLQKAFSGELTSDAAEAVDTVEAALA